MDFVGLFSQVHNLFPLPVTVSLFLVPEQRSLAPARHSARLTQQGSTRFRGLLSSFGLREPRFRSLFSSLGLGKLSPSVDNPGGLVAGAAQAATAEVVEAAVAVAAVEAEVVEAAGAVVVEVVECAVVEAEDVVGQFLGRDADVVAQAALPPLVPARNRDFRIYKKNNSLIDSTESKLS